MTRAPSGRGASSISGRLCARRRPKRGASSSAWPSAKLGAPEDALATKDGAVYVVKSPSKKVTYADLIGGKRIEVRLEKKPPIKPVAKHTVSGKPTLRSDARAKVTGEAKFSGDIRLPGMLYAAIVRPPAHGAKLKSADTSAAEKVAGRAGRPRRRSRRRSP